jgi:hypothetical protein
LFIQENVSLFAGSLGIDVIHPAISSDDILSIVTHVHHEFHQGKNPLSN